MYEVSVKSVFSAAHNLKDIGGKCENLHGHNFTVEVCITSKDLSEQGVVIDFRELKSYLAEVLEVLDHHFLNEIAPFSDRNPSSENIARFIHDEMKNRIEKKRVHAPLRVDVWESDTSRASYWEDHS